MIVADTGKLVDRSVKRGVVPVEAVSFGWEMTVPRIERLGGQPRLRFGEDGAPYRTDGDLILDCGFGAISDPAALDHALSQVIGVIETGLFIGDGVNRVCRRGLSGVCRLEAGAAGVQRG